MMRELTNDELESWKLTFAKDGIKYETDDEYREAVHNLVGYIELLIEMDQQQKAAERLEKPN